MRACSFTLLCSILITTSTSGQNLDNEKKRRLDSFFSVMEAHELFNGTVAVIQSGVVVYQRSHGYWSRESKTPNSATSPVNVASVSKPLTSLAILQLLHKKKLKLDDVVETFFPSFPYKGITIRQLLSHTSGLPNLERMMEGYVSAHPAEIMTTEFVFSHLMSGKDSLSAPPGTRWQYNNTNYMLLSRIISQVSKMPFAQYMYKNIFQPAGMRNSYIRESQSPNTPRYIRPTFYELDMVHVDSISYTRPVWTYRPYGGIQGSSNVVTTVEDLVRFDQALREGKLIPLSLLRDALKPVSLSNSKMAQLGSNRYYTLGWNVIHNPGKDTTFFHDGNIPGITAIFLKNKTKDQTIIYYDNTASFGFFQKVGNVGRALNGEPLNVIPTRKSVVREYGAALVDKGADYALLKLHALRRDTMYYYMDELQMNTLGYELLGDTSLKNHLGLAIEVFKINTVFYKTPNSFDSYGDALKKAGKKEEAIMAYEQSLLLNPQNNNARNSLSQLKRE
jgi:CubicO group peptidase (beta-lactamase class C family)